MQVDSRSKYFHLWQPGLDFQRLLVGFEEVLPLREPSELDRRGVAEQLYDISQGNLGDLRMLLVECARKAIETRVERITMDIVRAMGWMKPTRGIRERGPEGLNGRYPVALLPGETITSWVARSALAQACTPDDSHGMSLAPVAFLERQTATAGFRLNA